MGRAASILGLGVIAWLLLDAFVRPESGLPALANIGSTFIVIASLATLALVAIRGGRWPRLALVGLLVVSALRFGDEWVSLPAPQPEGTTVDVATWNLEFGAVGINAMRDGLAVLDVDVVALEELTRDQAAAIESDVDLTARYPYRVLHPAAGAGAEGMGLLSKLPLGDPEASENPARIVATIDVEGHEIAVLAVHPFPAQIPTLTGLRIPTGFDPSERNAELDTIRDQIDALLGSGDLILLGDLNTAPTEPAFSRLSRGLTDVHVAVGQGPGWTWRPSRLEFLGTGLLRIDSVLTSPGLTPIGSWVDCSRPGDHCLRLARLSIASTPP